MPESPIIDTSHIPRREPVLDHDKAVKFQKEAVNKQWQLVTGRITQDIKSQKEVRDALLPFTSIPVSESLASQALRAVSPVDDNVGKLAQRYEATLGAYVDLPSVPDDALVPDITYSAQYKSPEEMAAYLSGSLPPDEVKKEIQRWHEVGGFTSHTTTEEEKKLVATRYRFARDVKVLALGAELLNQDPPVSVDNNGTCVLPSGVSITVDKDHLEDASALLSPLEWERRRQIKDRVYEIIAGGKRYILKEQKTARHKDTTRHGHKPTNSSEAEFKIAQYLNKYGERTGEDVSVGWERPVGYVSYPDGYQFTVFEFAEGLESYQDAYYSIQNEIIHNPEPYRKDFEELSRRVSLDSAEFSDAYDSKARRLLTFWKKRIFPRKLTVEQYAWVKANYMINKAKDLRHEVLLDHNIQDRDHNDFGYQVIKGDDGIERVGIVGFDFEYYKKEDSKRIKEIRERSNEDRRQGEARGNWAWFTYNPIPPTDLQQKAYGEYVALQREKLTLGSTKE